MALPQYTQNALDAFYARGTYWSEAVGRSNVQSLHERNQCRHRVQRALEVLGSRPQLRVLDVGAGHGWTLYWLDRLDALASFDFIEPDDACSREIEARPTRSKCTRLASLAEARSGYNLVFLNHVLEHVADPVVCIEQIGTLLAPGGVAYFEMPYADQRFKPDVFPHTWFFTPEALARFSAHGHVKELVREVFGRVPTSKPIDLLWRAAYRASAKLNLAAAAAYFDDRIWGYAPAPDGIWIRWMLTRP